MTPYEYESHKFAWLAIGFLLAWWVGRLTVAHHKRHQPDDRTGAIIIWSAMASAMGGLVACLFRLANLI